MLPPTPPTPTTASRLIGGQSFLVGSGADHFGERRNRVRWVCVAPSDFITEGRGSGPITSSTPSCAADSLARSVTISFLRISSCFNFCECARAMCSVPITRRCPWFVPPRLAGPRLPELLSPAAIRQVHRFLRPRQWQRWRLQPRSLPSFQCH